MNPSNNSIVHPTLATNSQYSTVLNRQQNFTENIDYPALANDNIITFDHNDIAASFILPNLYELPDDIRMRVMDNLVDMPTMVSLEETRRLNWWVNKTLSCSKLYPLVTSGDGNCLLHATSLAMWGVHDHSLSMRKALNETLITSKPNNSLYRRWRWTQSVQNKKYGLVFSEQEWDDEWRSLLRLSSAEPRISQTKIVEVNCTTDESHLTKANDTNVDLTSKCSSQTTRQYYESLEQLHVYVLANNIRRPIVIFSDTVLRTNDGEPISPIEFGGIYLPLEIPPDKCHKQPIFLAYDAAHFSALLPMEHNSKPTSKMTYQIPLIDIDTLDILPIHFLIDPGINFQWPIDQELSDDTIHCYAIYGENRMDVLRKYLNLSEEYVPLSHLCSQTNAEHRISTPTINVSNESNSRTTQKKSSRPSLHSFSKMFRRTFIEPFSSNKHSSHKHARYHSKKKNDTTTDSSTTNENQSEHGRSSPLLNQHTNVLKIILTDFHPKRPQASENMIKNYIDTWMNEYYLGRIEDQTHNENEDVVTNINYNRNEFYPSQKLITSSLKRQQSLSSDKNSNQQFEIQQHIDNVMPTNIHINKRTQILNPISNLSYQRHL